MIPNKLSLISFLSIFALVCTRDTLKIRARNTSFVPQLRTGVKMTTLLNAHSATATIWSSTSITYLTSVLLSSSPTSNCSFSIRYRHQCTTRIPTLYLHYSSLHPARCKRSIRFSQFLRLHLICSDDADFMNTAIEIKEYSLARDKLVNSELRKVSTKRSTQVTKSRWYERIIH